MSKSSGHTVYTKENLSMYDDWLNAVNTSHWKCPTDTLLKHFNQHVSNNHLDVGVGTGYYLDHCTFPSQNPALALMDLNENCLEVTAERVERYAPITFCKDIMQPLNPSDLMGTFDSISCNYLLHCLPGNMKDKSIVFENLAPLLSKEGVVFGATILGENVSRSEEAIEMMRGHNDNGFFSNLEDTPEQLTANMETYFKEVSVEIIGCVAVFSCANC